MTAKDLLAAERARLVQLKAMHDAGALDDAGFESERRAIEHAIGDRLLDERPARPSRRLLAAVTGLVVAIAVVGYWQTGSPSLAGMGNSPSRAASNAAANSPSASDATTGLQQIAAMVDKLAARMKERPDDAEGWTMLARSYTVVGRFADALPAYERASALRPQDAALLADYADAVAATAGKVDNARSVALIERALAIDAEQPKALALAGTVDYDRGDYAAAVARWQRVAAQLPKDSELLRQVQASIDEARQKAAAAPMRGLAAAPRAASGSSAAASVSTTGNSTGSDLARREAPAAAVSSLSGVVTLEPGLRARTAPGDIVFVFARPASGGRMPLAVQRATVADLPLAFRLDDGMAMAPGMTLSSAPQVIVGARISRSGNAVGQPGDLEGEAGPVAPTARDVRVRIGTVRP